ncbi:MAG: RES domain-containing protein, partial [Chromatocurvus sp.]
WTHPVDYGSCQALEVLARTEGLEVIRYTSVRDPDEAPNVAILDCAAFAARAPSRHQTWRLWFNRVGVHAVCEFEGERFSVPAALWREDPRLQDFNWARA